MAYFSNGSEGSLLDEQCAKCILGDDCCPIFYVQITYNYEACNNKVASEILNYLIKDDGTCTMYTDFKDKFELSNEKEIACDRCGCPSETHKCRSCNDLP